MFSPINYEKTESESSTPISNHSFKSSPIFPDYNNEENSRRENRLISSSNAPNINSISRSAFLQSLQKSRPVLHSATQSSPLNYTQENNNNSKNLNNNNLDLIEKTSLRSFNHPIEQIHSSTPRLNNQSPSILVGTSSPRKISDFRRERINNNNNDSIQIDKLNSTFQSQNLACKDNSVSSLSNLNSKLLNESQKNHQTNPNINSTLDLNIIQNMINSSISTLTTTIRNDLQNMHVELIKQSLAQQAALKNMLEAYLPMTNKLMTALDEARDENERLKLKLDSIIRNS